MSYSKNAWETGDVITANKLNHIEDGIENNDFFLVTLTTADEEMTFTADKTYEEIETAYNAGMLVIAKYSYGRGIMHKVDGDDEFQVSILCYSGDSTLLAYFFAISPEEVIGRHITLGSEK